MDSDLDEYESRNVGDALAARGAKMVAQPVLFALQLLWGARKPV